MLHAHSHRGVHDLTKVLLECGYVHLEMSSRVLCVRAGVFWLRQDLHLSASAAPMDAAAEDKFQ